MNRLLFSTEDRLNVLLVLFDHLVVEEQQLGGGMYTQHAVRAQSCGSQGGYLVQTSLNDLTLAYG